MTMPSEWQNEHGERLRLEWEDGQPVLYHSDFDDVPVVLDVRVVGFRRDYKPDPDLRPGQITSETVIRDSMGDIVLSDDEQQWLLGEMIKHGMQAKRS
jgi:hypothetical protein